MMVNTRRTSTRTVGTRIDPTVVRPRRKVAVAPCLACASASRVAKHTH